MKTFDDVKLTDIDGILDQSWEAFHVYRKLSLKERAGFMREIAKEIEALGDELLQTAAAETNLPGSKIEKRKSKDLISAHQLCRRL